MQDSAAAARNYKTPLKIAHVNLLKETILASRRTMCPGCPSCDAFAATSEFALLDIARFVTYYEQDGTAGSARVLSRPAGVGPRMPPGWTWPRCATAARSTLIIRKS